MACLAAIIIGAPGHAQTLDPHQIYETQCAGCHAPHARELVSEKLDMDAATLVSRKTARPLAEFLRAGHGGLTADQIDRLVRHMTDIRLSNQIFNRKCAICHVRMRELVGTDLVLQEGRVVGRYTGTDIEEFLFDHGRLLPQEVPEILDKMREHLGYGG